MTVAVLLALAMVVSYFGDSTGQAVRAQRYTVTPVPVGNAGYDQPSSLGSSTSVSELSRMCAMQPKICGAHHYTFYLYNGARPFSVKAESAEAASQKCAKIVSANGFPGYLDVKGDNNGDRGFVRCPGCSLPLVGCKVANEHLLNDPEQTSEGTYKCEPKDARGKPSGSWILTWDCTSCNLVEGVGCTGRTSV